MLYHRKKLLLNAFLKKALSMSQKNAAATSTTPKKIEVFIDDKKILVDPGLTILQVTLQ